MLVNFSMPSIVQARSGLNFLGSTLQSTGAGRYLQCRQDLHALCIPLEGHRSG